MGEDGSHRKGPWKNWCHDRNHQQLQGGSLEAHSWVREQADSPVARPQDRAITREGPGPVRRVFGQGLGKVGSGLDKLVLWALPGGWAGRPLLKMAVQVIWPPPPLQAKVLLVPLLGKQPDPRGRLAAGLVPWVA